MPGLFACFGKSKTNNNNNNNNKPLRKSIFRAEEPAKPNSLGSIKGSKLQVFKQKLLEKQREKKKNAFYWKHITFQPPEFEEPRVVYEWNSEKGRLEKCEKCENSEDYQERDWENEENRENRDLTEQCQWRWSRTTTTTTRETAREGGDLGEVGDSDNDTFLYPEQVDTDSDLGESDYRHFYPVTSPFAKPQSVKSELNGRGGGSGLSGFRKMHTC